MPAAFFVWLLAFSWRPFFSYLFRNALASCSPFQHFHLRLAALPLGPVQLLERAQKLLRRAAALLPALTLPVTGAFNLLPVARLYFALPFAVRPPPCLTERFSPLPTERLTDFFLRLATAKLYSLVQRLFVAPSPTLAKMLKGL